MMVSCQMGKWVRKKERLRRLDIQPEAMKVTGVAKRQHIGERGVGGIGGPESRNRGMKEGCNAETCQKRAPGPPCGMWPVCLPRKNRAGEREERGKKGKRGRRPALPHH